jgi:hypothetical protein
MKEKVNRSVQLGHADEWGVPIPEYMFECPELAGAIGPLSLVISNGGSKLGEADEGY